MVASPTWRGFRDAFLRHPTAIAGGVILLVMIAIALLAPWLGTVDPQAVAPIKRLKQPSEEFWFGSDMMGRDVYSRVVYGARVSLSIGIAVAILSTLLGLAIGLVTGYIRWLDAIVMRVMDGLMSIPPVLLAIALMALTRASMENVIAAITLAEVPRVTRLVRSLVLTLRDEPYVVAAIAAGTRLPRILVRHILPNVFTPWLVVATLDMARVIVIESALSFLGLGVQPPAPTWGGMLADGRVYISTAWWLATFPGLAILVTVLGINLFGDGLRDTLDPRLKI